MSEYYETRYTFDPGRSKVWKAIVEYLQRFINKDSDCVLDLGAGYCDFINNVQANKRIAVDINPESSRYCDREVRFASAPVTDLSTLDDATIDVVFSSNLLEHLDDSELSKAVMEVSRITRNGARVILIQPNYRYAYREYFDDYTHKKVFTDVSLKDFFEANGFEAVKVLPRFLPLTLKSRLPKSYFLTKLYLHLPFKPMGKQMLLVFKKRGDK